MDFFLVRAIFFLVLVESIAITYRTLCPLAKTELHLYVRHVRPYVTASQALSRLLTDSYDNLCVYVSHHTILVSNCKFYIILVVILYLHITGE